MREASLLSLPILAASPHFLPFPPTTVPGPRLIFPGASHHGLVRLLSNCCLKILVVLASNCRSDREDYNVNTHTIHNSSEFLCRWDNTKNIKVNGTYHIPIFIHNLTCQNPALCLNYTRGNINMSKKIKK